MDNINSVFFLCECQYGALPNEVLSLKREERGMFVDHSLINRWAIRFLPLLEKVFRKHKRQVGGSWRMDETYIKISGQ